MTNRKYINLNLLIDIGNYVKSIKNWVQLYTGAVPTVSRQTLYKQQFDKYIEILKPIIYENSMIRDLKKIPNVVLFTTQLNQKQLSRLTNVINELKHWEIEIGEQQSSIIDIQSLVGDVEKRQPLTKVEIHSKPKNYQLELWNSNIDVSFINIKGPVVESKKIAKTSLGMPTANFKVDENLGKNLISYPNGIYVGNFKFLKNPDISYRAVCSLGINMHYENQVYSRKFQAFVCHKFDSDFYNQQAQVQLKKLIRLQGLFPSFDSFLSAMSNDIWVGKHIQL